MGQIMGVYSKTLLCPEASFKKAPSDVATKTLSLPFNTNGLQISQNNTNSSTITGRRDATMGIKGNFDANGDIVVPVDVNGFPWWLAFAFGNPTTSSVSGTGDETGKAAKYQHVFKPGRVQPSAIIEKAYADNGVFSKYDGCKVSQLQIEFGGDGELTSTVSIVGCKQDLDTEPLTTNPTEVKLNRLNNFQISSLKLDGTEIAICTQVTLQIDFGIDTEGYAIGDKGYRSRANEGIIAPSGQVTAFFDDASLLEKAKANKVISLEITLTNDDGDSLSVKLPELQFAATDPAIDGPTGLTQELSYNAFFKDNGDDTCVMFTVVNDTPEYKFEGKA